MSDFTPPSPKGPPGPPPRPAMGTLPHASAGLPQPNPFGSSDPDQTPVNRVVAPSAEHHEGIITSARELTPVSTAFAAAPKSRPVPPARIVEPTTPDPAPVFPTPERRAPAVANPFLAAPVAVQESQVASAPQPQVVPPSVGRPIVGQPGVESPHVPDPHAAFRKGNVLKRLLLVALAAALIGGLFFLMPGSEQKSPVAEPARNPRANAVIGSSVSPEIIPDPRDRPLEEQRKASRADTHPQPAPAARSADNDGFANSFKSSAK